ncbi:MAG: outer membrane protein assembly factor BamD [Zetaproteobacteria bacterium CG12_big_fil_rev_8_21_14_0_65_54_13]|nr:MAG: outer membrane protein assembly factor BamD [Zetaproteobacteria bacterium CG12_big_fil_rev_8_21_14_0_65_54_13]PIX55883.1 MAG: outer membrane protein assembly factor BamD [Zetaproteobacteria bacterium CG_4_10_14_3_um_filter_54_28]PJA28736.1 MAG: outer membrane protein assembly factor BamD [Zetaproteobacteria bacterium CG_4_9_14_3_um_filter_54_145]
MISKLFTILCICLMATLISGCAGKDQAYKNDAEREYQASKELVNKGSYAQAAKDLDHFGSKYPYSKFATPAELLRIFAAYKDDEFVLSEVLSQRFIDLHPAHASVDYAKYMLAMSQYKQRASAEKDPTQNKAAIKSFKQLIKDHPDSSYAKQGRMRLQSLFNSLAKHELTVGKFYYDRERFVASANRFQQVIQHYQSTPSIEEALYYLASSYARMDMKKDALQVTQLLQHNYPGSSWSAKADRFR